MRMTRQRQAILEVLRATKSHPSADWVFQRVRRHLPKVSLATVYRNLHQLAATGVIQELPVGGNICRFDADTSLHYHLRCLHCGRIDDLDLPPQNHLEEAARKVTDFQVLTHHVEFLGYCLKCARRDPSTSTGDEPGK